MYMGLDKVFTHVYHAHPDASDFHPRARYTARVPLARYTCASSTFSRSVRSHSHTHILTVRVCADGCACGSASDECSVKRHSKAVGELRQRLERGHSMRAGSWIRWQLAVRAGELGSRALVNSVDVCSWSGAPPNPDGVELSVSSVPVGLPSTSLCRTRARLGGAA